MWNIIMVTVDEKSVSEYSSLIAKISFLVHNRNSPKLCACQTGTDYSIQGSNKLCKYFFHDFSMTVSQFSRTVSLINVPIHNILRKKVGKCGFS